MHLLTARKYLWLGVVLAVLLFMQQYRPMARIPVAPYVPVVKQTPVPATRRRTPKKIVMVTPQPAHEDVRAPQDIMTFHLKSYARDYHCIFSGQTFCGQHPCMSTLDLFMESPQNPDMHRTFDTMPDGTFSIQVPVTESAQEQVDWKIAAHSNDGQTADLHGRRILMDEPVVSVEANLTLR